MSTSGSSNNNASTIRGTGSHIKLGNDIKQDTASPQQPSFAKYRNPKLSRPVVGTEETFDARATMIEDDNEVYTFSLPIDTLAADQYLMVCQYEYILDSISVRFKNSSTIASSLDIVKVSSGTAIPSGTSLVSAAVDLSVSANNNTNLSLTVGSDTVRKIAKNQAIALNFSGDPTGLEGLSITISLRRMIPATRNSGAFLE